jgi:hypothetical protein
MMLVAAFYPLVWRMSGESNRSKYFCIVSLPLSLVSGRGDIDINVDI